MPSRRDVLLGSEEPLILPSLLLCDFGHLAEEVRRLELAGVQALHLDVMDGHFVPNFTYGLTIVEAVRRVTDLPLDIHLMTANPQTYVRQFVEAGGDLLTIHLEAVPEPGEVLQQIHEHGALAGLAINPPTSVEAAEQWLPSCDVLLVMSVMPGFGGQNFDRAAIDKLTAAQAAAPGLVREIDGGIGPGTIGDCAAAGAQRFVVGSAIFGHRDYAARLEMLRAEAHEGATRARDLGQT